MSIYLIKAFGGVPTSEVAGVLYDDDTRNLAHNQVFIDQGSRIVVNQEQVQTSSGDGLFDASNFKYDIDNSVVLAKTDDDYRQERIANADSLKLDLVNECTKYQQADTIPRLDSNFFNILVSAQGLIQKCNILKHYLAPIYSSLSLDIEVEIPSLPCCVANVAWSNALWMGKYESLKAMIDAGDEVDIDFTDIGNPPHTFDECYKEVISYTPPVIP
jgi:hypothetical protein